MALLGDLHVAGNFAAQLGDPDAHGLMLARIAAAVPGADQAEGLTAALTARLYGYNICPWTFYCVYYSQCSLNRESTMARSKGRKKAAPVPSSALDTPETIEIKAGVFKNTCLELMDQVNEHAKQYVITKRGRPVAKLVPPDTKAPSAFGFLRGTVVKHGDIVGPDFEAWGDLA